MDGTRRDPAAVPPIHRPIETASLVLDRFGTDPFRVGQALVAGISEGRLRAAVAAGRLERLRPGVLAIAAEGSAPDLRRDTLAALLTLSGDAAASHRTAGRLEGLPDRRPGEGDVGVTVTAAVRGRYRAGIHVVEGSLDPQDVSVVDAVRCTSVARTALDLAYRRPLHESLVVLDAAVARVGRAAVIDAFGRHPADRARLRLEEAVLLADSLAESPLESASRGELLSAGVEAPELQAWVTDDEGRAWRVDFLWRGQRVVGEADGFGKYTTSADLRAEKVREDALRRAGWAVVRWTSDELWRTPEKVITRITRALSG
jgi:hypothetical protein